MRRYVVPLPRLFLKWTCPSCGFEEQSGRKELIERLRRQGMLRRDDGRDVRLLLELAASQADQLPCPECEAPGFLPVVADPDEFEGPPPRVCANCGRTIPPERVELFPDSELCAACQEAVDHGRSLSGDDYCPRCGSPMIVRQTGTGVTRYQQVCPQCRR
jgi:predicted RNA-binding Zn-ribbon protein involved in translation (DUF1610 family)